MHNLSFDDIDKQEEEERKRLAALNGDGTNGEDDLGVGEEEEPEDLLSQDPKEWKVCALGIWTFWLGYLTIERTNRNKTTMPSLVCRICDTRPHLLKSK